MKHLKNLLILGAIIAVIAIVWMIYTVLTQNPATETSDKTSYSIHKY